MKNKNSHEEQHQEHKMRKRSRHTIEKPIAWSKELRGRNRCYDKPLTEVTTTFTPTTPGVTTVASARCAARLLLSLCAWLFSQCESAKEVSGKGARKTKCWDNYQEILF